LVVYVIQGMGTPQDFLLLEREVVWEYVWVWTRTCVRLLKHTPNIGAVPGKRGASTMMQVLSDISGW